MEIKNINVWRFFLLKKAQTDGVSIKEANFDINKLKYSDI